VLSVGRVQDSVPVRFDEDEALFLQSMQDELDASVAPGSRKAMHGTPG
jgi:hypothetical protein